MMSCLCVIFFLLPCYCVESVSRSHVSSNGPSVFSDFQQMDTILLLVRGSCAKCYSLCRPCLSLDLCYGPALSSYFFLTVISEKKTGPWLYFFFFFLMGFKFGPYYDAPTVRYNLQPIHAKKTIHPMFRNQFRSLFTCLTVVFQKKLNFNFCVWWSKILHCYFGVFSK